MSALVAYRRIDGSSVKVVSLIDSELSRVVVEPDRYADVRQISVRVSADHQGPIVVETPNVAPLGCAQAGEFRVFAV